MAIAYDTYSGVLGSGSSVTLSHTCTGSDRFLAVSVMISNARSVTSVTYAGVAMTFKVKTELGSGKQEVHVYYLANPASGANNIVATIDSSSFLYLKDTSYTGVDQTTPTGSSGWNSGATPSLTFTTTVDGGWIVGFVRDAADGATTAGADTTYRGVADGGTQAYDRAGTTAGSYTLNVSGLISTGNDGGLAGMVINPSVAATTRPHFLLLGVA